MALLETISLDPFGFVPATASAIDGIGGGSVRDRDGYVFHTIYSHVEPGTSEFRLSFDGLESVRPGRLRILISELSLDDARVRRRGEVTVALAELAAAPRPVALRFQARPGAGYALRGELVDDGRASARALTIALDRAGGERYFTERLERASRSVYARGSDVGKRWWRRRSPVDVAGLVVDRTATLAAPISQMCTAAQFDEPAFERWADAAALAKSRHRKSWEFAYVLSVLETAGMLRPDARGLGFGVGIETLPSLFASMGIAVTATDLPADYEARAAWAATGQHSDDLSALYRPELCERDAFDRNVTFRAVDMNAIPADLVDFDFCWSACAYEHLGSIDAGLRFFRESMRCLKPGGVAVHTTELNLVSNDRTLSKGATVLFRRRDMEALALQLHRDGHDVWPITYDQGAEPPDRHVDVPPYLADEHLKIALASYVTTSFGLVARKGPKPA